VQQHLEQLRPLLLPLLLASLQALAAPPTAAAMQHLAVP
jgi:hypothetical protein